MKFLKQMCLVMLFSFLGELCRFLIPYPIPASIYGMVLLFAALFLKIIPAESVRDTGSFLTSFLPVLFVAPAVSLLDCWAQMQDALLPLILITLVSTVLVFGVGGLVTEMLMKKKEEKRCMFWKNCGEAV